MNTQKLSECERLVTNAEPFGRRASPQSASPEYRSQRHNGSAAMVKSPNVGWRRSAEFPCQSQSDSLHCGWIAITAVRHRGTSRERPKGPTPWPTTKVFWNLALAMIGFGVIVAVTLRLCLLSLGMSAEEISARAVRHQRDRRAGGGPPELSCW